MQVQIRNADGSVMGTFKALTYAFPKKGNAPEGYVLAGEGVGDVAQTGGGKYPRYTYFKLNGTSYYLPKDVVPESGATIEVLKAAESAPAEVAEQTEAKPKAKRASKSKLD